jgi:outer membrane receptor protein involved in Fe transport
MSSQTPRPYTGTASVIASAIVDERAHSTTSRDRLTWDARNRVDTPWADQLTTVLGVQRASRKHLHLGAARLNVGIANLTNRNYWLWSDVRGLDTASTVADAYSQSGRHLKVSIQFDF